MNRMGTAWILVCAAALAACGDTGGGASSAAPSASTMAPAKSSKPAMSAAPTASAATTTPAPTASAASAACSPKPPLESLDFKATDKKTDKGWPKFHATNVGDKTITFASLWGYAYDKDGKQVYKTKGNLSWNSTVKCGEAASFDVEIGNQDDKVPATATQFEICYDSVKFDGSDKFEEDHKRCPDKRPMGGVAGAPAGSASAAASAAPPKGAPPAPKK